MMRSPEFPKRELAAVGLLQLVGDLCEAGSRARSVFISARRAANRNRSDELIATLERWIPAYEPPPAQRRTRAAAAQPG